MLTTARRINSAAIVCALACALYASAISTASACDRACLRRIASLGYERIAAAYNPAWRGERSAVHAASTDGGGTTRACASAEKPYGRPAMVPSARRR